MKTQPGSYVQSMALAIALSSIGRVGAAEPAAAASKYSAEVAALAAAPAAAAGGILMVGSSIFRKWATCAADLAPLPVTNRGFGGSQTRDQLLFFEQIVPSSRAALVVWYCGSNDVNAKQTPESISQNTKAWIGRTQAALPQARILIVSVIRAPQKRDSGKLPQVDETNQCLAVLAASVPGVAYLDVNPALEAASGEPLAGCYVDDHLHLTPEGYRRMTSVLRPVIEKLWKDPAAALTPTGR
jgi:lysophospholipase L1-like esterase